MRGRASTNDLPVAQRRSTCEGCFIAEVTPWAGRFVKDADPAHHRPSSSERGLLLRVERLRRTATRSAGAATRRCSTTPRRPGTSAPPRSRTSCSPANEADQLAPRAHQGRPLRRLAREQRRLGALARALLGHAAAGLALRRRARRTASAASPSCASWRPAPVPDDLDLHRPYIDDVHLACPECGGAMRRVAEVIDAWFDSGSMPFAQWHYPFENEDAVRASASRPTSSAEAIDQTRGWFYTLLAGRPRSSTGRAPTSTCSASATSSTARARR